MVESSSGIPKHIHDAAARYWSRQQAGDPAIERELTRWLDADRRHRMAFEALKRDWRDSEGLIEVPMGQSRKLPRAPFYMRHSAQVALAGVAGLMLVVAATLWVLGSGRPLSPVTAAQAATFSSELGEIRHFTLVDGTELTLDTNSQVAVSSRLHDLQLEVKRGRVRIRRGERTRIVLKTRGASQDVRADGTFDIAAEPHVSVTAITGQVRLRRERAEVEISPGERLVVEEQAKQRATALELQWTSGMIVLQATPLVEAIAAINRYNRFHIHLDAPELADRRMTGAFAARDPQSFARAVAKLFGATVYRSPTGEMHIKM